MRVFHNAENIAVKIAGEVINMMKGRRLVRHGRLSLRKAPLYLTGNLRIRHADVRVFLPRDDCLREEVRFHIERFKNILFAHGIKFKLPAETKHIADAYTIGEPSYHMYSLADLVKFVQYGWIAMGPYAEYSTIVFDPTNWIQGKHIIHLTLEHFIWVKDIKQQVPLGPLVQIRKGFYRNETGIFYAGTIYDLLPKLISTEIRQMLQGHALFCKPC